MTASDQETGPRYGRRLSGRLSGLAEDRRRLLASNVRAIRKVSQDAVAARAGCNRGSVVRVENMAYSPTVDRLWRLADALGVEAFELLMTPDQRATWYLACARVDAARHITAVD